MNSIMLKISDNGKSIIDDNNFLFVAFQNRLVTRLVNIFDKYKIPINKKILNKNIEENLINFLMDTNNDVIEKYINLLSNYEKIIWKYIENKTSTDLIKQATIVFLNKISEKNGTIVNSKCSQNFIEYINSVIFVYDNNGLNKEILNRINLDVAEILDEFNKNNYNFVIESINKIIKNVISQI